MLNLLKLKFLTCQIQQLQLSLFVASETQLVFFLVNSVFYLPEIRYSAKRTISRDSLCPTSNRNCVNAYRFFFMLDLNLIEFWKYTPLGAFFIVQLLSQLLFIWFFFTLEKRRFLGNPKRNRGVEDLYCILHL